MDSLEGATPPGIEAETDHGNHTPTAADSDDVVDDDILSGLDAYIKALGQAVDRFDSAAAGEDDDAETEAADELAGLVSRFVHWCTNWPGAGQDQSDQTVR